jgi:phosphoribosylaminoimidazolecarboxamide formyltransferase/IMP cyclohydrolase
VLVNNQRLIANAVGQQDRVGSAELALMRARRSGNKTQGATAYSDSFFPFPDGPKLLADAGILTLCATKGSVNDELVKDVCKKSGMTLVLLPDTHARGFFGH